MESQPQNPKFRNNPENFTCGALIGTPHVPQIFYFSVAQINAE